MRSARGKLAVVAAVAWLLAAGAAGAQEHTDVEVVVARISDETCAPDPRARRLDHELQEQFRYGCLKVLETRKLSLDRDQVGRVALPNGKELRVRPLDLGDNGVLLAVGVEGVVETDLRVRSGHLVAIGAGRHEGGKLIISLEPRY